MNKYKAQIETSKTKKQKVYNYQFLSLLWHYMKKSFQNEKSKIYIFKQKIIFLKLLERTVRN